MIGRLFLFPLLLTEPNDLPGKLGQMHEKEHHQTHLEMTNHPEVAGLFKLAREDSPLKALSDTYSIPEEPCFSSMTGRDTSSTFILWNEVKGQTEGGSFAREVVFEGAITDSVGSYRFQTGRGGSGYPKAEEDPFYDEREQGDAAVDMLIEALYAFQDDDLPYHDIYDTYLQLLDQPIDLNRCNWQDLEALILLDPDEIDRIMDYREEYGPFFSLHELFLLEGLDSAKLSLIRPFLVVGEDGAGLNRLPDLKEAIKRSRFSFINRYTRLIQVREGYRNRNDPERLAAGQYYLGSPDHYYARFSLRAAGRLGAGLTLEKDPGEVLFFNPSSAVYGFDHVAGYVQYRAEGIIRSLVLGDFQVQSGQGLVAGNGLFIGKGTEVISTLRRSDGGIRPYQGSRETGFFRGAALGFGGYRWAGLLFFSGNRVDANIETQSEKGIPEISSLPETGYHRMPATFKSRASMMKRSMGLQWAYRSPFRHFSAGIHAQYHHFELPVKLRQAYYRHSLFYGQHNANLGVYHDYHRGKFSVFGEVAIDQAGDMALVEGIMANIRDEVAVALHLRHYGRGYHAHHGGGFAEYADRQDEQGIYWGLEINPLRGLEVHGYIDVFRTRGLRRSLSVPSPGHEWMIRVKYAFPSKHSLDMVFREEEKARNIPAKLSSEPEYGVSPVMKRILRFGWQTGDTDGPYLRSRIQGSMTLRQGVRQAGWAIWQDIGLQGRKIDIKGRVAWFNTEDYGNRQYAYEHDVLYYFSVPAYYGRGFRTYLVFKYTFNRHFKCWLKAGNFWFLDREQIGSGLEKIDGNKKTEIRCQVQIKF